MSALQTDEAKMNDMFSHNYMCYVWKKNETVLLINCEAWGWQHPAVAKRHKTCMERM